MIVTVNTDASYNKAMREGAYAYWIRSDIGKLSGYGSYAVKVEHPVVCEIMAMTKALHRLTKSTWKNITLLIFNTDCLNAIHYLNDDEYAIKRYKINRLKEMGPVADLFFQIKKKYFPLAKVEFRHVKAHTKFENDPRKYVNDWCDRAAKKGLNDKLQELQKQKAGQ